MTRSLAPGDRLVVWTDGVRAGFLEDQRRTREPDRMARDILEAYGRPDDDALALVAPYPGELP